MACKGCFLETSQIFRKFKFKLEMESSFLKGMVLRRSDAKCVTFILILPLICSFLKLMDVGGRIFGGNLRLRARPTSPYKNCV